MCVCVSEGARERASEGEGRRGMQERNSANVVDCDDGYRETGDEDREPERKSAATAVTAAAAAAAAAVAVLPLLLHAASRLQAGMAIGVSLQSLLLNSLPHPLSPLSSFLFLSLFLSSRPTRARCCTRRAPPAAVALAIASETEGGGQMQTDCVSKRSPVAEGRKVQQRERQI